MFEESFDERTLLDICTINLFDKTHGCVSNVPINIFKLWHVNFLCSLLVNL